MRAARIENGLVVDLWEVPSLDCYGPDVVLVEAPAHVQMGASYSEINGFSNPEMPEPTPQDLLNALDAKNALTQRNLRETIMLMNEAFKQISNGELDLSAIPGVAAVYAVEAEAEEIRAQL